MTHFHMRKAGEYGCKYLEVRYSSGRAFYTGPYQSKPPLNTIIMTPQL